MSRGGGRYVQWVGVGMSRGRVGMLTGGSMPRRGWVCPGVSMSREGIGMSVVGLSRGWVSKVPWYTYPPTDILIPSPVLTPSDGHQNMCDWQVGSKHPSGMLSCLN